MHVWHVCAKKINKHIKQCLNIWFKQVNTENNSEQIKDSYVKKYRSFQDKHLLVSTQSGFSNCLIKNYKNDKLCKNW